MRVWARKKEGSNPKSLSSLAVPIRAYVDAEVLVVLAGKERESAAPSLALSAATWSGGRMRRSGGHMNERSMQTSVGARGCQALHGHVVRQSGRTSAVGGGVGRRRRGTTTLLACML